MQPEDLSFAGSERRIVEEWLQTEQSETLAADPFEHRASLKSLLELTVVGLFTLLALLLSQHTHTTPLLGLAPMACYHIYSLVCTLFASQVYAGDSRSFWRSVLSSVSCLAFCLLQVLFWTEYVSVFISSVLPLVVAALVKPCLVTSTQHEGDNCLRTVLIT